MVSVLHIDEWVKLSKGLQFVPKDIFYQSVIRVIDNETFKIGDCVIFKGENKFSSALPMGVILSFGQDQKTVFFRNNKTFINDILCKF